MPPGNNSGAISLIGNLNYLRISNDSVFSYLPYFGERQMQIDYGNSNGAIELKGIMKDYLLKKRNDNGIDIRFEAKNNSNSENFNVYITLWPSLKANITLNSGARFPISYSGSVKGNLEKE